MLHWRLPLGHITPKLQSTDSTVGPTSLSLIAFSRILTCSAVHMYVCTVGKVYVYMYICATHYTTNYKTPGDSNILERRIYPSFAFHPYKSIMLPTSSVSQQHQLSSIGSPTCCTQWCNRNGTYNETQSPCLNSWCAQHYLVGTSQYLPPRCISVRINHNFAMGSSWRFCSASRTTAMPVGKCRLWSFCRRRCARDSSLAACPLFVRLA